MPADIFFDLFSNFFSKSAQPLYFFSILISDESYGESRHNRRIKQMTDLDTFVVSGNDDKIKKLKALIEKRQLSNEDLALILRTVKAREESK